MWEVEAFLYLPGDLQTCIFVVVKEEHCKILFSRERNTQYILRKVPEAGGEKKEER